MADPARTPTRASEADLRNAVDALRHEADCYEPDDELHASLNRAAEWVAREVARRVYRAAIRQVPDPVGFRQVTPRETEAARVARHG